MFGGTTVKSTTDPREALPLYFAFQPDLILLDLHMPHLDGFAVIEQLKEAVPVEEYLPILVLTADITVETKRRALASGAKDLVTKPLDHFEVVLRINNLLENRFLHLKLQNQNGLLEQQVRERTAQVEETLTELRSTQEHVVKHERLSALGMMAGGIAHDFNNALTMVLGYGELLLPYVQANAPAREIEFLRHIVAAAQDATHVVSRLREFYRPATGDEIRVAVDLNNVVEQAVLLTTPKWKGTSQAEGAQIEVQTNMGEIPPVAGNAAELREVLANLIFNAADAMPRGGRIVIRTNRHEECVRIAVTDTGIGMSESERERCLEPFFTTKGERGTGLGLSVVYGIVQRHGGTIEIESKKGRGTTFCIDLPATAPIATETPETVEKLEKTLRILVADDQEIICELLAEYLQSDGHETVCAFDGLKALEQFREGGFDLVITDQSMPGMNGEQLAAAIAELSPEIPIILLTGFGQEMRATDNHPENIDLVLGKPVTGVDLRRAIQEVITKEMAEAKG
jgi:signal transduction histidine kinase